MKKNLLFFGVIALAAVIVAFTVKFQSVEDYNREHGIVSPAPSDSPDHPEELPGNVRFRIVCTTILDNLALLDDKLNRYEYARTGVMLEESNQSFSAGETVYSLLLRQTSAAAIPMVTGKNLTGTYVKSLWHLDEFSCGRESGWMYRVNGKVPLVPIDKCKLKDGDRVELTYTCKLGGDLATYDNWKL